MNLKKIAIAIFTILASVNLVAQNIPFTATELYPEGLAYNPNEDIFYVSSLHYGTIGKVNRKGEYSEFIKNKKLVSTIGIHLNNNKTLLYVCVSDPGVSVRTNIATQMKMAKVIAFDIKTGKQKLEANLGAFSKYTNNFANDLDFDTKGNAYVTNSASPIIYKITPNGKVSIFATSVNWKKIGFNLNGIVYNANGYLLAIQSNTGELYKILLSNPTQITKVNTNAMEGGDGLISNGKNELLVISNSKKEVYQLKSTDNFASASLIKIVATEMDFPTTGVYLNAKYYVLNAKLNEIFDSKAIKTSNFLIQEIK